MENPKRPRLSGPTTGLEDLSRQDDRLDSDDSFTAEDRSNQGSRSGTPLLKSGKKTRGRVKINMEFIDNKLRRYTTFSKRKSGIMKKAHELATLTGTQVMLLVASETGHVYTFATRKLQPILSSEAGKQLIQTCLNSPDPNEATASPNQQDNQRMSAQGFEEPELSYAPSEDTKDGLLQKTYHILNAISAQQHEQSPSPSNRHIEHQTSTPPVNLVSMSNVTESGRPSIHFQNSQSFTLMPPQSASPQLQHQHIQLTEPPPISRMHMVPVTQDRSACSSIPPPNVHTHHSQARTTDDPRVTLLNSYSTLQRPLAGNSPLLVTGTNSLQLTNSQVTLFGHNNKKQTR